MNLKKNKKQILAKLSTLGTTLVILATKSNICFANGIGTQEVQTATDNIKRVITSIAMPLGRSSYICKRSNCSNKNDYKC